MNNLKRTYQLLMLLTIATLTIGCNNRPSHQEQFQVKNDETIHSTRILTDSIKVKTILIGGEDVNKNNFTASYPYTVFEFINEEEETFTKQFEEDFTENAALFKEESISKIHYGQHFEVVKNNSKILSFMYERYQSSGNNYADDISIHHYDLEDKKRLKTLDFFKDENSFKDFTQKINEASLQQIKLKIDGDTLLTKQDKNTLYTNLIDMVKEGTSKLSSYDAVDFNSDTTKVYFDKYQIVSGNFGAVVIRIPTQTITPLLNEDIRRKLNIKSDDKIGKAAYPKPEFKQNAASVNCNDVPCVALTFDDGPSVHTNDLLDILKKEDIQATFFVLGKSAKVQKNTILRTRQEGHQIGNHSWDHKNLKNVGQSELEHQIFDTNNTVKEIIGEDITVFRPPYGSYNNSVKETANMPIILWNLDPLDWKDKNAKIVADRMSQAKANGIILAHDIHKSTVDAIPAVIKALREKGYHMVTINQLLGDNLSNGKVYSHK